MDKHAEGMVGQARSGSVSSTISSNADSAVLELESLRLRLSASEAAVAAKDVRVFCV
jgi:hypothetical protein